jgi:hypothetical protein
MSDTPPNPNPPAPPPAPPAGGDLEALNRWAQSIGAQQKNEGKAAAERALAEKLGMTPDEAATFIEEAKQKKLEGLEEADRKLAEATEKEAKAIKAQAEADARALNAEIRAALIEAGLDRTAASTVAPMVQVDAKDWDEAKVTASVEALKKSLPQLFPESDDEGTQTPPPPGGPPPARDTTTRGNPPPPKVDGGAKDRAKARLLERHPART